MGFPACDARCDLIFCLVHFVDPGKWLEGPGFATPAPCWTLTRSARRRCRYCMGDVDDQVMSELAEPTMMSMLGPVTCSALTVIDPLVPPDELVCWLMMTLIPPGSEMEKFGLEVRIDWPATVNPTNCAFPLVLACFAPKKRQDSGLMIYPDTFKHWHFFACLD